MQYSAILILFLFLVPTFAEQPQEVLVTLPNGLKQKALFYGTQGDTVLLGGIVNGEPTTVRIPRNRIQSLVLLPDSTPVDLQTPPPPPLADTETAQIEQEPEEHDWFGHLLVLPPESGTLDSLTKENIRGFMIQILRERTRMPILSPSLAELQKIPNTDALVGQMRKVRALGLIGSQWKIRNDSIQVSFRVIWTQGDSIRSKSNTKSSSGKNLSHWLLSEEPWIALEKTLDIPLFTPSKKQSSEGFIWVETEPDGALISVNGEPPICKSPCRVPASPDSSGKITLHGAWKVTNHLWAGKTTLSSFTGDSTRAFIRLQPSHAVLQIHTTPIGASIYPNDAVWSPSLEEVGKSPLFLQEFEPGQINYRISYPGYRDTLVRIIPDPSENSQYHFVLQPILDRNELAAQNARLSAMTKCRVGKGLMGASIAPIAIGATLIWLSQKDYREARSIKNELIQPSAASGPNFEKKVEENHDAVKAGDNKVKAGVALIASAVAIWGVGFSLWF